MRRGEIAKVPGAAVSKAIVLAGGDSVCLHPLTEVRPKSLLPVVNRPLIEWQLQALRCSGIEEVGIALSPDNVDAVSRYLESRNGTGVRIHVAVDEVPWGPAGGIKLFEEILEGETFLVVDGSTFLRGVRIDALVDAHRSRGAMATLGTLPHAEVAPPARAVVSSDGRIRGIFQLHESSDRRHSRALAGLNVFDSDVLRLIPEAGYLDIKEGLFEKLQEQGSLAIAETTQGQCVPIDSVQRYYQLQAGLIDGSFDAGPGYRQVGEGVWIGEGSELPESAYVLGPALIGSDCRIDAGAQLVGPVVIGDGSEIGSRSLVRASILWDGSKLASGCTVESSIVASGASISDETSLKRSVVVPAKGGYEETWRFLTRDPLPLPIPSGEGRSWYAAVVKPLIDYVAAGLLLILASPIFLLCPIAIRLDSRGSAFFRQLRCGKGGRPFWMLKFRTMVDGAEDQQAELRAQSDIDGPLFKMVTDPRVTRLGGLLRRTSIDELPQLLNVLRGEMSLVGPRPLEAEEMSHCPAWRDRRLSVKPGITGLWQVNGRSRLRFHEWIQHDIEYVKRQSLGLDLLILAKTVGAVIRRSGA